jgi:signal transduction histidine kinase
VAAGFAGVLFESMPVDPKPSLLPGEEHLHLVTELRLVLALAAAAPLVVARQVLIPALGLALMFLAAAATIGVRTWPYVLLANLLLVWVAAARPWRISTVALGAAVLVGEVSSLVLSGGGDPNQAITVVLISCVAWLIGSSVRQRREYTAELRARAAAEAVTAERLRIARELHDMVAHSIGVIAIQAGAGARVITTQPEGAREALRVIEVTSRQTLAGLRHMLGSLRQAEQSTAAEAAGTPRLADVEEMVAGLATSGLRIEVRVDGRRRPLPPEIEVPAFRIIQESVTNVVRHADARNCQVSISYGEDEVAIEVVDDGRGGPPGSSPGSGFGIVGMRERVRLLNGQFSAESRAEGGFQVTARLPA